MTLPRNKIIFVDIDGPMIPAKAVLMPGNGGPDCWNWNFDIFAVRALNFAYFCDPDVRLVLSSHRWGEDGLFHTSPYPEYRDLRQKEFWVRLFEENGVAVPFHDDWITPRHMVLGNRYFKRSKYIEIMEWRQKHPEVKHFVSLEDDLNGGNEVFDYMKKHTHLICEDYEDGMTFADFRKMLMYLGLNPSTDKYREFNDNALAFA